MKFNFRVYYSKVIEDPSLDLGHTYGPSKSFFSLLRFERVIKQVSASLPFDGRIYVVNKGDVVTAKRVQAGQYKLMSSVDDFQKAKSVTVGREFWLLVTVPRYDPLPNQPYKSFSWLHMKFNAQNQLEMLDGITAYEEPGLVIGQKTPCQATACQQALAQ